MSCTTCPNSCCTCCNVYSVAVDNSLTVGGTTALTTGAQSGGALTVNSCTTQTSGELVRITGTADQTALQVDTGTTVVNGGLVLGTASNATPASASATGTAGEVRWDGDYVYVCVGTDTWKRAALATW